MPNIMSFRERIDAIDGQILELLGRRFKLVGEIAKHKNGEGLASRDVQRESEMLRRLVEEGGGVDIPPDAVQGIFGAILHHSVEHQRRPSSGGVTLSSREPVTIAYQGIAGAYSHSAALEFFDVAGANNHFMGCRTFTEVADAVRSGIAKYGLLPIENTTAGSITDVYDLLAVSDLPIVGEAIHHVDHCLIGVSGATVESIRTVRSHPQALAQCQSFFNASPWIRAEAFDDTAMAAQLVQTTGDPTCAAIASADAAHRYGLFVIRRHLADQGRNYTRFVVVAREPADLKPQTACKTSLILTLRHSVGSLAECLVTLADHGVNLSRLESRPLRDRPWEYLFYVDCDGHWSDAHVGAALDALRGFCADLRLLGSYPSAPTPRYPLETESP